MKNPHIELVKKWLADPKSVSQEELERTAAAARVAADSAYATYADAAYADTYAADAAAAAAADGATYANAAAGATYAKHWVKKYEERTQ